MTFILASIMLRATRKRDLLARGRPVRLRRLADRGEQGQGLGGARGLAAADKNDKEALREAGEAVDRLETEAETGGLADGGIVTTRPVKNIVFACDAGMGSSAMGASVLRNKIKKAGIDDVTVVNKAIANLDSLGRPGHHPGAADRPRAAADARTRSTCPSTTS